MLPKRYEKAISRLSAIYKSKKSYFWTMAGQKYYFKLLYVKLICQYVRGSHEVI